MNKYNIGDYFKEDFSFKQKEVIQFAKLTGDCNPLHLDEEFAKQSIFKRPIIHGFLSASIFSKIIGMKFPGEGSIYLTQELSFHRPMYIETMYTAKLVITEVNHLNNHIHLETTVFTKKNDKTTISGKAIVKVPSL